MADGGRKFGATTIRSHIEQAEVEIAELNRQIRERERLLIPTVGLETELAETIADRDTLLLRLQRTEERHG